MWDRCSRAKGALGPELGRSGGRLEARFPVVRRSVVVPPGDGTQNGGGECWLPITKRSRMDALPEGGNNRDKGGSGSEHGRYPKKKGPHSSGGGGAQGVS